MNSWTGAQQLGHPEKCQAKQTLTTKYLWPAFRPWSDTSFSFMGTHISFVNHTGLTHRYDKIQVQRMVKMILNAEKLPKLDDITDSMAIAICHAHSAKFAKCL